MPVPIPKPKVFGDTAHHFVNFVEAQVLPFTDEHQPSFANSALRKAVAAKKKQVKIAGSRLAVSMVANALAPNITKLKNRSAF
jgi:hypothetical protein